jgi:hypothetical protein
MTNSQVLVADLAASLFTVNAAEANMINFTGPEWASPEKSVRLLHSSIFCRTARSLALQDVTASLGRTVKTNPRSQ